jgi:hypothetical protein
MSVSRSFEETIAELRRRGPVRKRGSGSWYEAQCPAHNGGGLNLHVWKGRDGSVGLKCWSHECSYKDIVAALGLSTERHALSAPTEPPSKPVETHETARYRTPLGEGDYVDHIRREGIRPDGTSVKEFAWERIGESGLGGLKVADVPLYGADNLKPGPVFVCEGEKAAKALIDAGYNAVGTVGGAGVTPSDDSLSPLLGHPVCLWPDNDDPGREHMRRIAERLLAHDHAEVLTMVWPDAPAKGDAHDAVMAGVDVQALLDAAEAPADKSRARLGLVRPEDWLDSPEPPIQWVIDGLIARSALTMVAAFPKSGKSTFARHFAVAVAKGERFLGRDVMQGPVIYLAIEELASVVRASFRNLGIAKGDALHIKTGRAYADIQADIEAEVRRIEPVLLVVDTVTRLPRVSMELNDYAAWSRWLEALLYLGHETGCAVVPLYHSTKSGRHAEEHDTHASVMGSVGISATYDQLISLRVESDGTRSYSASGRFEPVPSTLISLDRETQRLSAMGTKADVAHQELRSAVMDAIGDDWVTTAEIVEAVKRRRADVDKVLAELVEEALLDRQGKGKARSPHSYRHRESRFPVSYPYGETGNDMHEELVVEEEPVWQSL